MTFDSVSEWSLLQSERHFRVYPYRERSVDDLFTSKVHLTSPRSKHSTSTAWHQLFHDQKAPVTLDRPTYKLRMKSDLNVKTLKDTDLRRHRHPSTRLYTRQPTALTLTSQTMKSVVDDDEEEAFYGIEGNAVRVGTLDDLIKQFRRAEFQLVHRPPEHFNSTSTFFSQNLPSKERLSKQAQALTEYQIPLPNTSHRRDAIHPPVDLLPPLVDRHRASVVSPSTLPLRQSTAISFGEKREKQMCVCNKLTIVDPFNSPSEQNDAALAGGPPISTSYIFPPIRSSGYFTKKHLEEPLPKKRRLKKKKKKNRTKTLEQSFESFSIDDDDSHAFSETMKSMVSLATSENDLVNPPNTIINSHLDPDAGQR